MEGRQLRRNQFRSGKQIAKHYGDKPSKQALHRILRFSSSGRHHWNPSFIRQRALMVHRAFQARLARPATLIPAVLITRHAA
jgi:hypothetical protein